MRRTAVARLLLGLAPVALCALSAHATLYRSVLPSDGVHGYFGWYEPLVAALSLLSAGLVLAAGVVVLNGRRWRALGEVAGMAREVRPPASAARLAALGVTWLFLQESVERSVAGSRLEVASFGTLDWAIVVVTAVAAAVTLTLLARLGCTLAAALRGTSPSRRRPSQPTPAWWVSQPPIVRRRALADRRGLRAPPLCA